ncbi:acetyltransferase, GNAT family [Pseudohyphozyma bogoriensis]|nr:acetyltransferase, GNAT family [Pseudohyphozyma bogoriensis]
MTLQILPATYDDLSTLSEIHWAAVSPTPVNQACYPSVPESTYKSVIATRIKSYLDSPTRTVIKAVREDGVAVGFASWVLPGDEESLEVKAREERELSLVVTDPRYSRTGAATALVAYYLEKADAEGLPTYLHSSAMARPIYVRAGFVDYEEPAVAEGFKRFAMVRQPVARAAA